MMRILKICCAVILALMLGVLMYVHFRQDDLSRRALQVVRNSLATELHVGHVHMEILTAFPHLRFEMHDVALDGKEGHPLLTAAQFQLSMSLFSIFSDELKFRTLTLSDGAIAVQRLADGSLSLDILKKNASAATGGPALDINTLTLQNIEVSYTDAQAQQEYTLYVTDATLRGRYAYDVLKFNITSAVRYDMARLGNDAYLNGARGELNGSIALDFAGQIYTFRALEMVAGKQKYTIDGTVRDADDHQYIDISVDQTAGDIASFLHILPAAYRKSLPVSNPEGAFVATCKLKGRMSSTENPHVQIDFDIRDGRIKARAGSNDVRDLSVKGTIDNGAQRNMRSATITATEIRGTASGKTVSATVHVSDLGDPLVECTLDGALPAELLADLAGLSDRVKSVSGIVHFKDIMIGPLRTGTMDMTDVSAMSGQCTLDNIKIQTDHTSYQLLKGTLHLQNDTLKLRDVVAQRDREKIIANGWFTGIGDALEGGDPAYLRYTLDARAQSLDITRWLPGLATSTSPGMAKAQPVSSRSAAPVRLPAGALTLIADQFQYNAVHAEKLSASFHTALHLCTFDATCDAMEGSWMARGTVEIANGYVLKMQMLGDGADVRKCFAQCNDFGQSVIRAEHLRGKGDLRLLADLHWDAQGRFSDREMHVLAGISIHNGELQGFDMLDQFSDYVHTEDLRNIKFRRLDNFIEVRNGNVYLPAMFVQSNAANLAVNGVHTLDNRILYNLKINAGQVLSNKMKKHDARFVPLPARAQGTFNLFFTISGTTDVYEYAMNKVVVESSFQQSTEFRERIREQLRSAFGEIIDLIEPPDWETIPEYDVEPQGEDVFLDIRD